MARAAPTSPARVRVRRRDLGTTVRYVLRILREFRVLMVVGAIAIAVGAVLWRSTPQSALGGACPSWSVSVYAAWMAFFAQAPFSPPDGWYLEVVSGVYPLLGVFFIGEGLVRFALLMVSRRRGEKEWMTVLASTYRNHVVICGLGHLGFRVLAQLVAQGREVVAIEKDANGRFVEEAKTMGVAVLIHDMKDDEALRQAGVEHAQTIIAASDDDMANLEVVLDAKRMNPTVRTAVRLFDQAMASKLRVAFGFDFAFSASALAAPTVAAMSLPCRVVSAFELGGASHVIAELAVEPGSRYVGARIADLEAETGLRVLGRGAERPQPAHALGAGDVVVVHGAIPDVERGLAGFKPSGAARPG
jgi:Trk K+ transport system NAD-binding subunit